MHAGGVITTSDVQSDSRLMRQNGAHAPERSTCTAPFQNTRSSRHPKILTDRFIIPVHCPCVSAGLSNSLRAPDRWHAVCKRQSRLLCKHHLHKRGGGACVKGSQSSS